MSNLTEYLQNLQFEYAITYSGLRGEKFEELKNINKAKIKKIEEEIKSARYMPGLKMRKEINRLEKEMDIYNSRLINKKGETHLSAQKIHKFDQNDKELVDIFEILNLKVKEQVVVACPPIFRDSIVFYSKKNEILGILHFCFSCFNIRNENGESYLIDLRAYDKIKKILIKFGHPINEISK